MARVTAFQAVGRGFESRLPLKMSFTVYILESVEFDRFYIGQTENLKSRIEFHNSSREKWTKRFQPWVLIHSEDYGTRAEAMKRECYLKSLKNTKGFLESLRSHNSVSAEG